MNLLPIEQIEKRIYVVRDQRVMLDSDLAEVYGVSTKRLNEQVKRNRRRFPPHFMLQLSAPEAASLMRSQIATLNLKSQIATSRSQGWGGRRKLPFAFTEHGAVMLASVLNSPRAVQMSIYVVEAFVRIRKFLAAHQDLARKLEALEKKYDAKFKGVFKAIRALMDSHAAVPRSHRLPPVIKIKGFALRKERL